MLTWARPNRALFSTFFHFFVGIGPELALFDPLFTPHACRCDDASAGDFRHWFRAYAQNERRPFFGNVRSFSHFLSRVVPASVGGLGRLEGGGGARPIRSAGRCGPTGSAFFFFRRSTVRCFRVSHLVPAMCRSRAATTVGVAVREVPYDAGPSADFPEDPLQGVVRPDAMPVLRRERVVGERLDTALPDDPGRLPRLHSLELA